jgi:hypothetical protein
MASEDFEAMGDEAFEVMMDEELSKVEAEIEGMTDDLIAGLEADIVDDDVEPSRKKRWLSRGRDEGNDRLMRDYFVEQPVYGEELFRRRFRMSRSLFLRIMEAVVAHDNYFVQRMDATKQYGFSPHQKCTAALRMLAYGSSADSVDETVRMGASTILECMRRFCTAVIQVFGAEYERRPTSADITRLLHMGERRGFPGYIGSLDCMHWQWKNCPTAWKGEFGRGDHGNRPTIMLEAVASTDLWIWHAFFGSSGANNDINVLNDSHIFQNVLEGHEHPVEYEVNGTRYNHTYYLVDGIYPTWSRFVKTIPRPLTAKDKLFSYHQESARKDVERAFGVLQSRWHIITRPARVWDRHTLANIMHTCIILHNMIVEDERDTYQGGAESFFDEADVEIPDEPVLRGPLPEYRQWLQRREDLHDAKLHRKLQSDLVAHIWTRFSQV